MSKILRNINREISSLEKEREMESVFKDARLKLSKKYKISPFGSFGKHLVTSKTRDVDIDIFSNCKSIGEACKEKKEVIKMLCDAYSCPNPSIKNSTIDFELPNGITASFTLKFKDNNGEYVKVKCLGKDCDNGGKSHKNDLKSIFDDSTASKRQKWTTRKFVKIFKYQLSDANKGIPMYILEHSLANKLLQSSNSSVQEKFVLYKDFLKDFGTGRLDSLFKNEIKKQDYFDNVKGRSRRIYNKIKDIEWKEFDSEF